eukprot:COSAG01_NODE_854_length_13095_cov_57.207525_12_plen_255_part_00
MARRRIFQWAARLFREIVGDDELLRGGGGGGAGAGATVARLINEIVGGGGGGGGEGEPGVGESFELSFSRQHGGGFRFHSKLSAGSRHSAPLLPPPPPPPPPRPLPTSRIRTTRTGSGIMGGAGAAGAGAAGTIPVNLVLEELPLPSHRRLRPSDSPPRAASAADSETSAVGREGQARRDLMGGGQPMVVAAGDAASTPDAAVEAEGGLAGATAGTTAAAAAAEERAERRLREERARAREDAIRDARRAEQQIR